MLPFPLSPAEMRFLASASGGAGENMLKAFINHLTAQEGKHISETAAADLIAWAQALAASLQPIPVNGGQVGPARN